MVILVSGTRSWVSCHMCCAYLGVDDGDECLVRIKATGKFLVRVVGALCQLIKRFRVDIRTAIGSSCSVYYYNPLIIYHSPQ